MNDRGSALIIPLSVVIIVWTILVLVSGIGFNALGFRWDFSNSAYFGESFGGLGVIFAAIAALFTFQTIRDQRDEFVRIHARELLEQQASRKRDFEQTFFGLLTALQKIVSDTDIQSHNELEKNGRDAFKKMFLIYRRYRSARMRTPEQDYALLYDRYKNDLGHYFRFLYHFIKYVDQADVHDKTLYIRLLRASISDAELALIALNCELGIGKVKFKPLAIKYSLLQNMSHTTIADLDLVNPFDQEIYGVDLERAQE